MSTYTPIATQTLASDTSLVTFSSIPQGYTDLVISCNFGATVSSQDFSLRLNEDSGSNYSGVRLIGQGGSAVTNRDANSSRISVDSAGVSTTLTAFDTIHINNYSNSSTYKTVLTRVSDAGKAAEVGVGMWRNTAPITSIQLAMTSGNLLSGSTFSIYGIQAGNSLATKAQGGNIVTTDGTYWYHTFTSSGSFIPSEALTVDYLVVAGGGGGGSGYSATGAGAGGLRSTVTATGGGGSLESPLSLTAKPYPVIVGAGGTPMFSQANGTNGGNSVFSTITSIGGGGGTFAVQSNAGPGIAGGSGGGSAGYLVSTTGGAGTSGQGFRGGHITVSNGPWPAGTGGGGAGAVGGNGTGGGSSPDAVGSAGGNGVAVSISGASVTYAGGGGGTSYYSGSGSYAGGSGGGGAGSAQGTGTNGVANLGGGGGGGGSFASGPKGGNGGSGIVIIRYAV
jgi:hypothetical protein